MRKLILEMFAFIGQSVSGKELGSFKIELSWERE